MRDYYAILELGPGASREEVRAAYRRLAFIWHPDRNPHRREQAHERFLDLGEAYAALMDAEGRERLDRRHRRAAGRREPAGTGAAPPGGDDASTSAPPPPPRSGPSRGAQGPPKSFWDGVVEDPDAEFDELQGWQRTPTAGRVPLMVREREVRRLALRLASADRGGRWSDGIMIVLIVFSCLAACMLFVFLLKPGALGLQPPPLWSPLLCLLIAVVLVAWMRALRELRARRYVPWAERVLDRRERAKTRDGSDDADAWAADA